MFARLVVVVVVDGDADGAFVLTLRVAGGEVPDALLAVTLTVYVVEVRSPEILHVIAVVVRQCLLPGESETR